MLQKKKKKKRGFEQKKKNTHTWHIILGYSQISVNIAQNCF